MRRLLLLAGGACAGAVAMFLLDPVEGRRRRGELRDRTRHVSRSGAEAVRRAALRSAHEARGLGWRVSRRWMAPVTDDILVERVRSQVGHAVRRGSKVEVAVSDGRVTLSGPVYCGEVHRLLRRVSRIPGVSGVVNEVEAWPKPCDQAPASQSA
jgi:osmotically-inducible protein OsmY